MFDVEIPSLCIACFRKDVVVLIGSVLLSLIQRPIMPKASKNSAHGSNHLSQGDETVPSSQEEFSSSEQDPDPEISFHQFRPPQPVPNMFMPYIEDPKMNWTVNNGLYHRFLKWCLKCENILGCELSALPE